MTTGMVLQACFLWEGNGTPVFRARTMSYREVLRETCRVVRILKGNTSQVHPRRAVHGCRGCQHVGYGDAVTSFRRKPKQYADVARFSTQMLEVAAATELARTACTHLADRSQ